MHIQNKKLEKKVIESLGALFLPHPRRTFPFIKPLNWLWGGKPFKFERNMRALRRSPKGAREDWSWFWFTDAIMQLLCWVASHLYQFGRVWPVTSQWWQRCCFFCLGFWELVFLTLGFLTSFFASYGGAPKIDLPLSMFSLANSVLISLFSILTLLAEGTKTVVLVEAVLEEEIPYPKPYDPKQIMNAEHLV